MWTRIGETGTSPLPTLAVARAKGEPPRCQSGFPRAGCGRAGKIERGMRGVALRGGQCCGMVLSLRQLLGPCEWQRQSFRLKPFSDLL